MNWIDTHTHIYFLESMEEQYAEMKRSLDAGVYKLVLAGVDKNTVEPIERFCKLYPNEAFASIGLHPTDVKDDYQKQLFFLEAILEDRSSFFKAIGEIGMDLYHDKSYLEEQKEALKIQIRWAKKYDLPIIFHVRDAFEPCMKIIKEEQDGRLRGVFHCYSGSYEQAKDIINLGFKLGIGGVVTFKNAHLAEVVRKIDIQHIVLETDAPYLAPSPYRGEHNESKYIPIIGAKVAELKNISIEEAALITTQNAEELFRI